MYFSQEKKENHVNYCKFQWVEKDAVENSSLTVKGLLLDEHWFEQRWQAEKNALYQNGNVL